MPNTCGARSVDDGSTLGMVTIEFVMGLSRKGTKRCLLGHKPFKKGENWQRHTSPADPIYGAYMIGIRTACLKQAPRGAVESHSPSLTTEI